MSRTRGVREILEERTGLVPKDAFSWLYASRGLFRLAEYHLVLEALGQCLRNSRTKQEAQHLLALSLYKLEQLDAAAPAFYASVQLGNATDWQPLVELAIDLPTVSLSRK